MKQIRSYEEMGFTKEELYTEKALPYWQQFAPLEFTEAMRGEIMNGLVKMVGYLQWIYDDPSISAMKVHRGEFEMSVKEICENILNGEDMIKSSLDLAIEYMRQLAARNPQSGMQSAAQSGTQIGAQTGTQIGDLTPEDHQ